MGKRLFEGRRRRIPRRLVLHLVTFGFGDLDDALDAEQAIDAGRHGVDWPASCPDLHVIEESTLSFMNGGDRVGALDVEVGVDRPSRQHLAGALFGKGLQFIPAGGSRSRRSRPFALTDFSSHSNV